MDQIDCLSEGHVLSTQFQVAGLVKIVKIVALKSQPVSSKTTRSHVLCIAYGERRGGFSCLSYQQIITQSSGRSGGATEIITYFAKIAP